MEDYNVVVGKGAPEDIHAVEEDVVGKHLSGLV